MGRIYSEASNTVIWLGPSNENIDLMVSWLRPSQSPAWLKVNAKAAFSEKARRERDIMTVKAVAGYVDVLMRPYWYRMWTFQEFLLPPSEPVCYCGTNEFNMTSVNEIKSRQDIVLNEVRARVKVQLSSKDDEALEKDADLRDYVEAVHHNIRPLGQKTAEVLAVASVFKIRDVYHSKKQDTLAWFLGMTGERNCYMGHDKFFALYGILPVLERVATVDYNKPLRQLTLEMTEHMVSTEQNKNIYACFPLREGHLDNDSEYPSWIPEYSRGSQETDSHNLYDTGEWLAEELRYDNLHGCEAASVENLTILRAHGVLAGTITHTIRFGTTMAGIIATLNNLMAMDDSYQEEVMAGATLRKQSDIPGRVAHASVSNMLSLLQVDLNMVDEIKEIHGLYESGETPRFKGKWQTFDTHNKFLYLSGKAVFFTDTGVFGIGVSLIEPGNNVVILKNERLPIVLARQEADVDTGKESFLMVGTAYLDGLMENEWKDAQLVAELSEQQPRQEFLIN